MEIFISDSVDNTSLIDEQTNECREPGSILKEVGFVRENLLNHFVECELGLSSKTADSSVSYREQNLLDVIVKKEQSVIDSSESIPRAEEIGFVDEMERESTMDEEHVETMKMQVRPSSNKNVKLPMPVHMYSRRKKGKNVPILTKDSINGLKDDTVLSGFEHVRISEIDNPDDTAKVQNLCHGKKMETAICLEEEHVHANTVCTNVSDDMLKLDSSKFVELDISLQVEKEQHNQNRVSEKKRGCNRIEVCVSPSHEVDIEKFLKSDHANEVEGVATLIDKGRYAAIRAGLRASEVIPVEKAWFKDFLKQTNGVPQYIDHSDCSSKFLMLLEGFMLPLNGFIRIWQVK